MFSNCIDRFGHEKREKQQQQQQHKKNKEKMVTFPVYKIYLYRHFHQVDCIAHKGIRRKQGWIGLLFQHPVK